MHYKFNPTLTKSCFNLIALAHAKEKNELKRPEFLNKDQFILFRKKYSTVF